jgi:beta-galactosidase/beta-glucuronidase
MVREDWLNLNGEWEFEFDDELRGDREQWQHGRSFSRKITVPFCFQSKLSGIGETGFHDQVWYRKTFTVPPAFAGKRVLLHFGAVDYEAWVWVNGQWAAWHEGGHTPFSADITHLLKDGENVIVVKARDDSHDLTMPRGKQYWHERSASIWYTRTTGIWQTVWLEAVSEHYVRRVRFTPYIDTGEIHIRAAVDGGLAGRDVRLETAVTFKGNLVAEGTARILHPETSFRIGLKDVHLWSPANPNLYDVRFRLFVDGALADEASSYFGMRKVSVEDGRICLNNRPYYLKMVLDQGYFPDGILTAPTDEALKRDVELTKAMGFNGARKHQKVEDPRYLYWCDRLGLLVWGEMANAQAYSERYVRRFSSEWQEVIERDYNHACIMAWVPINESWGVNQIAQDARQQQHALAMYHLIKSLDQTRLVISNDGWEHVRSDLCTIHDYSPSREVLEKRYQTAESSISSRPANRNIYVGGYRYAGEPIVISEFGGISFKKSEWEGWGYSAASDELDFLKRYMAVVHPLLKSTAVQGFCYTQLTDVEQEINGLLTYEREPKVPLELIRQINEGKEPNLDSLPGGQ